MSVLLDEKKALLWEPIEYEDVQPYQRTDEFKRSHQAYLQGRIDQLKAEYANPLVCHSRRVQIVQQVVQLNKELNHYLTKYKK